MQMSREETFNNTDTQNNYKGTPNNYKDTQNN